MPAPSFRFSQRYGEQAVQFFIIEMLDGVRQVLGQDVPGSIRRRNLISSPERRRPPTAVEKRSEFALVVGSRPM